MSPGFFFLRAPLYPFDEFLRWTQSATDRTGLRATLREIVWRREVREALFLASPGLEGEIAHWIECPDDKRGVKVGRALLRYFARMTGRATPFGLFAGFCTGTFEDRTELALDGIEHARRHTRFDHLYVTQIADDVLAGCESLRRRLRCWTSSSAYELADRIRFAEPETTPRGVNYMLSSVPATAYLRSTLARAQGGATAAELAAALVAAQPDVSLEEATQYIDQLQLSRVVDTELAVPITGREPMEYLIAELHKHAETQATAETLARAARRLEELDRAGVGCEPVRYRVIADDLAHLPHSFDLSRLFQVDLETPVRAVTLSRACLAEIEHGVHLLHTLASPRPSRALREFAKDFEARYGEREIPLLAALDEESGIRFGRSAHDPNFDPSPLLRGFGFPDSRIATEWQTRDVVLLQKLIPAIENRARELVLDDADVQELTPTATPPLCDSLVALASIAAASPDAIDRGEFLVLLQQVAGPTALRIAGRFAHSDPRLADRLRQIAQAEAACQPNAIVAEIVHVPEGRVGNIVARPLLREYEIPYLGRSGAPAERQIATADLLVSVVGGRVSLRSRRLGCEVLPRNSTAFKYTADANLTLYAFLNAIQQPGHLDGAGWRWGPLADSPYLPRVRHGKCVLHRAQWNVDGRELERLATRSETQRLDDFHAWRAARRLPRFAVLDEGETALPLDLDNPLCVDLLVHQSSRRRRLRVLEMFPGPDELCVAGPTGRFVHELVVPFVAESDTVRPQRPLRHADACDARERSFAPGASWAYAKLYASPSACDQVLLEIAAPLLERAESRGAIDRWFFIRYADPDQHLRVRFHGQDAAQRGAVERELERRAREAARRDLIWRFQWDTYEQECERYGGHEAIVLAESVFHADSLAAVTIVETLQGSEGADARWRLTLLGIDRLLDDLTLDTRAKHDLMAAQSARFARELEITAARKPAIDRRFRDVRASLEVLLARMPGEPHSLAPGVDAFAARSRLLAPAIARLSELASAGALTTSWSALAASIVHMHVNRMTRSNPRAHELLIYGFLQRLYRSRLARARPNGRTGIKRRKTAS